MEGWPLEVYFQGPAMYTETRILIKAWLAASIRGFTVNGVNTYLA